MYTVFIDVGRGLAPGGLKGLGGLHVLMDGKIVAF